MQKSTKKNASSPFGKTKTADILSEYQPFNLIGKIYFLIGTALKVLIMASICISKSRLSLLG